MADELKDCPFCGSPMEVEATSASAIGPGKLYVICDCGARSAGGVSLGEAIAAWNRRAAPIAAQLDPQDERAAFEAWLAFAQSPTIEGAEWPTLEVKKAWLVWQAARAGAAQLDAELPPLPLEKIIELAEQNEFENPETGRIGFDRLGFAQSVEREVVAPYAERIRLLERELERANAAYQGVENSRKADEAAVNKILYGDQAAIKEARRAGTAQSIDTRQFRALFNRYFDLATMQTPNKALCDEAWGNLVAYIDGRTAAPVQSVDAPDWRVGEFWSSARPGEKVLMLARGIDIENFGRHKDFIRWVDGRTAGTAPTDELRKTVNAHCNDLLDCAAILHDDGRFKATAEEIRLAVRELKSAMTAGTAGSTVQVPVDAYLWLMGMGNDGFVEDRRGAFWWRSAFNERAGLDMVAIYEASKAAAPSLSGTEDK